MSTKVMRNRHSGSSVRRAWMRARTSRNGTKLKYLAMLCFLLITYRVANENGGSLLLLLRPSQTPSYDSLPVERVCTDGERRRPAKPLIALVAGGSRSGTTYLYNLIRIVLRQRDPNTISGWYEDLAYATRYASPNPPSMNNNNFRPGLLDAYNSTGTTVLVKVHTLAHATRLFTGCDGPRDFQSGHCPVDLIFLTHRDLGPQVNSLRRMGWGRQQSFYLKPIIASKNNPHQYCRAIRPTSPLLVDTDWESPETWATQAQAIAMCHLEFVLAAGKKLALDMAMEKSLKSGFKARVNLADDIIRSITSKKHEQAGIDLLAAVTEADALRPLDCASWQAVNPITHFHRGHVAQNASDNGEDEMTRTRGYAAIERDPYLAKW
eukprot:CAMPEP_0178527444 /NCGR_PEP_ID=MMETSP0696-20121128/31268_1 /TAXON_ID=265572 /ORGANISM="Extubocellulus spinifer, Strain CCMP396" /LENGTH=378 /DNA_ID=CAMNT_0020159023 /DNA_START=78 /DNA_END=1211 /DNA_ORIENTATION=-